MDGVRPIPQMGGASTRHAFGEGVYVNFLGGDEDPDRVREAYGDSIYDRLVDVKTTYDPDNVFHHNQNIRSGTGTRISGASRARPH
jgi:FAD/FMN-containing dehydrogenase